jgi:uncharacterized protein YneF (UPF0154 family)
MIILNTLIALLFILIIGFYFAADVDKDLEL